MDKEDIELGNRRCATFYILNLIEIALLIFILIFK